MDFRQQYKREPISNYYYFRNQLFISMDGGANPIFIEPSGHVFRKIIMEKLSE